MSEINDSTQDTMNAWALGQLTGAELADFERQMLRDPGLAAEAKRTMEALTLMALGTPVEPSRALKSRVLAKATAQSIDENPVSGHFHRGSPAQWLWIPLAAAIALTATVAWQWRTTQRELLATSQAVDSVEAILANRDSLLARLVDPSVESYLLVASPDADPRIRVLLDRRDGKLVLSAASLPQIAEDKDYQLWYIVDGAALSATVFHPDNAGNALAYDVPLPATGELTAIAVTIEQSGGATAPTSTPIYVVTVGE